MDEAKWYLRTPDETFGPETEARLIEWAKLGRVLPGQEISEDEVIWTRVEDVAFLDMRFSIDIGDGNPRGPFNRVAAEALLASGRLPPTASLVEVRAPFNAEKTLPSEADGAGDAPCAENGGVEGTASEKVVEKIVEKVVEVPVEKVVEKVVEKIVVDETRVKELEGLLEEERRHTADLQRRIDESQVGAGELKAILAEREADLANKNGEIESLEASVRQRDALVAERDASLKKKDSRLSEDEALLRQREAQLASRDKMLAEKDAQLAACNASLTQKDAQLADVSTLLAKREAELAAREAAAKDAEARAEKLSEQVVALEDELKRLPAAASEVADIQAAVYKIMQEEAAVIAATLEREKAEFEEARQRHQARTEQLMARRHEILKMSGRDLEDMTRKALAARPEDPRTACLRRDYEELRRLHEKAMLDDEAKIRRLTEQLRDARAEGQRLGASLMDITQIRAETEQLRERLQRAEMDLVAERQRSEELRQREEIGRQALLKRLASLESPSIGTAASLETNQSREAKMVKLPGWMRLHRT